MCGRFTLRTDPGTWAQDFLPGFEFTGQTQFTPRFNISPTQQVTTVTQSNVASGRELRTMRWGLVPSWSDDLAIGNRMINGRGETIAEKPAFRSAFKHRRCLVPADGYYEWHTTNAGKQPFLFEKSGGGTFALAGLWEVNQKLGSHGEPLVSFCLITTTANGFTSGVHDRMPVILDPSDWDLWLDPTNQNTALLQSLVQPAPDELLSMRPVSRYVNSPRHEGPECIASA